MKIVRKQKESQQKGVICTAFTLDLFRKFLYYYQYVIRQGLGKWIRDKQDRIEFRNKFYREI